MGNIKLINKNIILLFKEIICYNSPFIKIDIDKNYNQYNFNLLYYFNSFIEIFKLIIDKIQIFGKYLIKVKYNYPVKNLQAIILSNII